jgi:integrase
MSFKPKKQIERWVEFHKGQWGKSSQERYTDVCLKFCAWVRKEKITFGGLRYIHIHRYMEFLKSEAENKGQYIMWQVVLLRRWFEWMEDDGVIVQNPVMMSHLPKYKKCRPQRFHFTWEQYQALLAYCDEGKMRPFWKPALIIAWNAGFRMGDVALLKWENINFDNETIRRIPCKTESFGREIVIPMEPELYELLLRLYNLSMDTKKVFVQPAMAITYQWDPRVLVSDFKKMRNKLGFFNHSFHSLRHSFVTKLLNAGVDPITICSMTGHTLRELLTYQHISDQAKASALEKARYAMHQSNLVRIGLKAPIRRSEFTWPASIGEVGDKPGESPYFKNKLVLPIEEPRSGETGQVIPPDAAHEMTTSGQEVCFGCNTFAAVEFGLCANCLAKEKNQETGGEA